MKSFSPEGGGGGGGGGVEGGGGGGEEGGAGRLKSILRGHNPRPYFCRGLDT